MSGKCQRVRYLAGSGPELEGTEDGLPEPEARRLADAGLVEFISIPKAVLVVHDVETTLEAFRPV